MITAGIHQSSKCHERLYWKQLRAEIGLVKTLTRSWLVQFSLLHTYSLEPVF